MPADLDQFGRQYSHGAVIGGEGFVKLGHVTANTRGFIDQVHLKACGGKIKGCLNTANPPANHHDVAKLVFGEAFAKLFDSFFVHFMSPH
jgi:hypothetical protein